MGRTDENRAHEGRYAVTEDGEHRIYMHRLILGLAPDDEETVVEHLNGDTLDNRRQNLRILAPA